MTTEMNPPIRSICQRSLAARSVAAVGLLAALITAPLAAGGREPLRLSDAGIEELVEERLARKGLDTVEVLVREGEVVLRGTVGSLDDQQRARRVARRTDAVRAVYDQTSMVQLEEGGEQDLMAGVSRALANVPYYNVFDWVEVGLEGTEVVLSGSLSQPWKRDVFIRQLEKVRGVTAIRDQTSVLLVSNFDDRIRLQVARSIYGNLTFFGRANSLNQPVHIVVEGGRVTLEGVVGNNAERMLARSLAARSANSIGPIVNNLKTIAEIAG